MQSKLNILMVFLIKVYLIKIKCIIEEKNQRKKLLK